MTGQVTTTPTAHFFQPSDVIEILPVALLDRNRPLVNDLKLLARSLDLEFGWHYLLDLTWTLSQLGSLADKYIMDAGAGTGIIQWYMAYHGANVLSVDRNSRAGLPPRFRSHFRIEGLRAEDLGEPLSRIHTQPVESKHAFSAKRGLGRLKHSLQKRLTSLRVPDNAGRVIIYNQDLGNLLDIADNSLDAVVAVSSLEHNTPDGLAQVAKELERVIKPGGVLLATLGAAPDQDWFHQASQGWCYTDNSLRRLFDLSNATPSNYVDYQKIMEELRNCAELRDNLASFYYKSGDNGMPWGKWDPQYAPVGVRKIKPI